MSSLSVYFAEQPLQPLKVLTHVEDIAVTLKEYGIGFTRVPTSGRPQASDSQAWLSHYQPVLAQALPTLKHVSVLEPKETDQTEHAWDQPCAYMCASARVLVYVHQQTHVLAIECEARDLLQLPAETTHWLRFGDHTKPVVLSLAAPDAKLMAQTQRPQLAQQFSDLLP